MNAIAIAETKGLSIILPEKCYLETGLVLPAEKIEFAVYEAVGKNIQLASRAVNWWIGDWILYGDHQYGEMYAQAVELTGRTTKTLENIVSVCRIVKPEERRAGLSFSCHANVTSLPPNERRAMLDKAEQETLSSGEIRGLVRESKRAATEPTEETEEGGGDQSSRERGLSPGNGGGNIIDVTAEGVTSDDADNPVFDSTGAGQRHRDERDDKYNNAAPAREAKPADVLKQIIDLIDYLPPAMAMHADGLEGLVSGEDVERAWRKLYQIKWGEAAPGDDAPAGARGEVFPDNTGHMPMDSSGVDSNGPHSEPSSDEVPPSAGKVIGESEQPVTDHPSGNEAAEVEPEVPDADRQADDPESVTSSTGFDRERYNSETVTEEELRSFYDEGEQAFRDGTALTYCPDVDPKDFARAWVDGWQDAKAIEASERKTEDAEAAAPVADRAPAPDPYADLDPIPTFMDQRK